MEINSSNIINKSNEEIFSYLLPLVNQIYKSYKFLSIGEIDYYNIVKNEIEKSKKEFKGKMLYEDYIKNNITKYLDSLVKDKLNNPDKAYDIIGMYISYRFFKNITYQNAIKNISKLNNFLAKYQYSPNIELLIELINNNILINNMIKIIVNKDYEKIIEGNIDELDYNNLLIMLIEIYCKLNNIEIKDILDNDEELENKDDLIHSNSYKQYLNEIGKYPLLSYEETIELAKEIEMGNEKAREKLINSNLRLVVHVARKYINSGINKNGINILDLIQEGNIGLIDATYKYDYTLGFRFSTYATWRIRQKIARYLEDKERVIRLPVHIYGKISLINKAENKLKKELLREPTIDEIANEINMTIEDLEQLYIKYLEPTSLNLKVGDKEETELENFVRDKEDSMEDDLIDRLLPLQIRDLIEKCELTPREKDILYERYGFNDGKVKTLEEIGVKYKLTRERVRQIEAKAIKKIRNSKYIKDFAIYTDYPDESLRRIDEYRRIAHDSPNSSRAFKSGITNDINKSKTVKSEQTKKERKRNNMKQGRTIYEYLGAPKEVVDEIIEKRLIPSERYFLLQYFDGNLDNSVNKKRDKKDRNFYYSTLIPMIKRMIEDPNYVPKRRKRTLYFLDVDEEKTSELVSVSESETTINESKQDVVTTVKDSDSTPMTIESTTEESIGTKENNNTDNSLTKEESLKILELMRTPSFSQMLSILSVKEAVIISLKLGYIDGKYFETESIAEFLGISVEEVIEVTRKVLLLYRNSIVEFIDNTIALTTEESTRSK